jgi:hypothetical protein
MFLHMTPISRNWIYIDAANGKIVATEDRIESIDVPQQEQHYTLVLNQFYINNFPQDLSNERNNTWTRN